jgi:hypothetical protein
MYVHVHMPAPCWLWLLLRSVGDTVQLDKASIVWYRQHYKLFTLVACKLISSMVDSSPYDPIEIQKPGHGGKYTTVYRDLRISGNQR